jgi:photosystem II stability/assembly factor-like uncharacterized protein
MEPIVKKSGFLLASLLMLLWMGGPDRLYGAGQSEVHDDILSVTYPSELEGWTSGRWGVIQHTTDGGATWDQQESGTEKTLISIFFIDPLNGWAVGDMGTILHTNDGGTTWQQQKSPVAYYHMGVFFISPKKGWIISERTHILYTENGGETWQIQFKDQDFILKGISFSDPEHGWVVGEFGYIYHTSDGGQNWQQQAGNYDLDYETGELVGDPSLFDVAAIDAHTVFAVGMDGTVVRTDDGGMTWQPVDTGARGYPLYCIASDGDATLVVGGKGGGFVSINGGLTWQLPVFDPPITYSWIYGIARQGAKRKFAAVGESGAIYKSNSVQTWEPGDGCERLMTA